MDLSVHNVLVGYGAHKFALSQGLKKEETLHPDSKAEWREWSVQRAKEGKGGKGDSHDTIGPWLLPFCCSNPLGRRFSSRHATMV